MIKTTVTFIKNSIKLIGLIGLKFGKTFREGQFVYFMSSCKKKLSGNFSCYEFACTSYQKWGRDVLCFISIDLINILEMLRKKWGVPIFINSGFRTLLYNEHLIKLDYPASRDSKHLYGTAADIRIQKSGYNVEDMKRDVYDVCPHAGVGLYTWGIHIDLGPKREWDYR